jgi:hypothetical protein
MPTDKTLADLYNQLTFTNGLLIFIAVYLVLRDIYKFIKTFITGGFV